MEFANMALFLLKIFDLQEILFEISLSIVFAQSQREIVTSEGSSKSDLLKCIVLLVVNSNQLSVLSVLAKARSGPKSIRVLAEVLFVN